MKLRHANEATIVDIIMLTGQGAALAMDFKIEIVPVFSLSEKHSVCARTKNLGCKGIISDLAQVRLVASGQGAESRVFRRT